ncbi:MAG: tRNA (adenine-N1)-methyltransferase [Deferribacteraceae bacterium]|jgi:tRNA (adenine57-N1/adenine58-N1)-methyltransferase|nr:tRNA (adenine-N1)-methyltransferase [Deferribacteraceae bacterium]
MPACKFVILRDRKKREYMLTLKENGRFSSQHGFIEHADIAAAPAGSVLKSTGGEYFTVFPVTYRDYVMNIKRQAQIIYPKDTAAILMWGDIGRDMRVLESGIGQGALSIAILRALSCKGLLTSYEIRRDFADMSKKIISDFLGYTPENHTVEIRDIYNGIDGEYDRILLDLPEPWQTVKYMESSLVSGGIVVSYIPTVLQVKTMVDTLKESGFFANIETFELILRPWKIDGLSVRPEMWIYNHSAFIISARKLAEPSAKLLVRQHGKNR